MPREITPVTGAGTDGAYSSESAVASESGEEAEPAAAGGSGDGTDPGVALMLRPGSPVRIGPYTTALATLLTCGHYLPIGRATSLLAAMSGIGVSTGFMAGARRRAAAVLDTVFLPHMRELLRTAPVLHVDETTGRAAGALAYVHIACTEYLAARGPRLGDVGSRRRPA